MSKSNEQKCLKGITYGSFSLEPNTLICQNHNSTLFKITYDKIQNTTAINQAELLLEMNMNDANDELPTLCEMRFFLPGGDSESFNEKLSEKTSLKSKIEDKKITTFEEVKFITPRGKHSVTFLENSMKFHGGTFNYKTEYKNIGKAFLLPDTKAELFNMVLSFKQPLRQGSTKHHFFIIQFEKEATTEIKLTLSEKDLQNKYSEVLQAEYNDVAFELFSKMFKVISNINIIVPKDFNSSSGESSVKCSIKNTTGNLYFLQKSLIFLPKASFYFKIDEIKSVSFQRLGNNKTFDMEIRRKDNSFSNFLGIEKKEHEIIENYFKMRNVTISVFTEKSINNADEEYEEEGSATENQEKGEEDDDEDDESYKANEDEDDS